MVWLHIKIAKNKFWIYDVLSTLTAISRHLDIKIKKESLFA